jgi:hypothetical protein
MSCDLTLGYNEPCKSNIGGIDTIYFVDFGDLGAVTMVNDEITNLGGTFNAYRYTLKSNENTFTESITSDRQTGVTFWTQTLNLSLKGVSKAMNKELKLLAYGRPHVVIVDRMGNARMMGLARGAEVTGGDFTTGGAMADKLGYSLTLVAEEAMPANFIASPTAADPFDGMAGATATIVVPA